MRNPMELDLECYCPDMPERQTRPADDDDIASYKEYGWLDGNGNITEKGKYEGGLSQDYLAGRETEEHFSWRLRVWRAERALFDKWYKEKWGPYAAWNAFEHPEACKDFHVKFDLPFPSEERRKLAYTVK